EGASLGGDATKALEELKSEHPDAWSAYRMLTRVPDDEESLAIVRQFEESFGGAGSQMPWASLRSVVARKLVALGVNPAGPRASFQEVESVPWFQVWAAPNGEWVPAEPQVRSAGQRQVFEQLDRHLADALFNRGGRDYESIGLGWAEPKDPVR